jgi:hypothetical protein
MHPAIFHAFEEICQTHPTRRHQQGAGKTRFRDFSILEVDVNVMPCFPGRRGNRMVGRCSTQR